MKSRANDTQSMNLVGKINACNDITELKVLVQSHLRGAKGSSDFDWVRPILEKTTSEALKDYLTNNPPNPVRLNLLDLEGNLTEAAKLMSTCISRYQELLSLETGAISSALDLMVLEELDSSDELFSLLELNAQRKVAQYDTNKPPLDKDLQARLSVVKSARKYRLMLHNQPGNALNFGERVLFLRGLLANTLRAAIEFMTCAGHALQVCYEIDGEKPPTYSDEFSLKRMMLWIRGAIRALETAQSQETSQLVVYEWWKDEPNDKDKEDVMRTFLNGKSYPLIKCHHWEKFSNSGFFKPGRVYRLGGLSGAFTIRWKEVPADDKKTPEERALNDMKRRKYENNWESTMLSADFLFESIIIDGLNYQLPSEQLEPFPVIHTRPILSARQKIGKQMLSNYPAKEIVKILFRKTPSNTKLAYELFRSGEGEERAFKDINLIFEYVSTPHGIKIEID